VVKQIKNGLTTNNHMKDQITNLWEAGNNVNRIAAHLMIQKSEVQRIVDNLEAKKNSPKTTLVDVVEKKVSKKKK